MKRFTLRFIIFILLLGMLIIPFNVLTDPYNVFHAGNIRDNGVEPNKNYIKTRFVLDHKDEYDSYLFGSSRAGFYDVSVLPDGNWYNLSYSEAIPSEQVNTLKALIAGGEIPKQVFLSIDNIAFLVSEKDHENVLYRKEYPFQGGLKEKKDFYISYMDSVTTFNALKVMHGHKGDDTALQKRMYSTGCEDLDIVRTATDEDFKDPYWADYYSPNIEKALSDIKEFCDICKEYDIKLTVFTNPLYIKTYERSVQKGYLIFLDGLCDITPFYNFSGYNEISQYPEYWYETSHFTPEAGRKVLERILIGDRDDNAAYGQGYGFYVLPERKEEFMTILYLQVYVTGVLEYPEK